MTSADRQRSVTGPAEAGRHNTVPPADHGMMIAIVSVTRGRGGWAGQGDCGMMGAR